MILLRSCTSWVHPLVPCLVPTPLITKHKMSNFFEVVLYILHCNAIVCMYLMEFQRVYWGPVYLSECFFSNLVRISLTSTCRSHFAGRSSISLSLLHFCPQARSSLDMSSHQSLISLPSSNDLPQILSKYYVATGVQSTFGLLIMNYRLP